MSETISKPQSKRTTADRAKLIAGFDQLPDDAKVPAKVVAAYEDVGESTLWRWVANGSYVQPIRLSVRCTRFRVGDVRRHRMAEAA